MGESEEEGKESEIQTDPKDKPVPIPITPDGPYMVCKKCGGAKLKKNKSKKPEVKKVSNNETIDKKKFVEELSNDVSFFTSMVTHTVYENELTNPSVIKKVRTNNLYYHF